MKKCETFGCQNPGEQMYQVAPATNVWLCARCIEEMRSEQSPSSPREASKAKR